MTPLYAIFCADPLELRSPDPAFADEAEVARAAGFTPVLVDHDELDQRINVGEALRRTRLGEPGRAVYRGWMLRGEAYPALHEGLANRGVHFLTSPAAYDACHHAPESYEALRQWLPEMTTVEASRMAEPGVLSAALAPFGHSAVVLKDWVKSQAQGYWSEACFIPDASNLDGALRVIAGFRELQGDSLTGGLVFKRYIPLQPKDGPADEHRAFIVGGRVVGAWPRSPDAARHGAPPRDLLAEIAAHVPSPFASADFGVDEEGRWRLLEVGDGQVSGLPCAEAAAPLWAALAGAVGGTRLWSKLPRLPGPDCTHRQGERDGGAQL